MPVHLINDTRDARNWNGLERLPARILPLPSANVDTLELRTADHELRYIDTTGRQQTMTIRIEYQKRDSHMNFDGIVGGPRETQGPNINW